MKSLLRITLLIVSMFPASHAIAQGGASQNQADVVDREFNAGNTLMEQQNYCDALTHYTEGLKSAPDDTSLLYNGGLAAFQCKKYERAAELWESLRNLDPADWQVRTKLIQTYQALGRKQDRDAERAALFDLRKQDSGGDLSKQEEYCREQFEVNGQRIMAFEYFELKGDRALRYVFSVLNESGSGEKSRISLGSYAATNAIWHQTTEPRPKETDRLFHLDGYYDRGHATYGFYFPEPSYDDVRQTVIEIMENRRNPTSSSTVK